MKGSGFFRVLILSWFGVCAGAVVAKSSDDCQKVAAAFDIGSGSTKMKVARVDVCQKVVLEVIETASAKVNFKDDLANSTDNTFSEEIQKIGLETLLGMKSTAEKSGAEFFVGGATSAFRSAGNGKDYVNYLSQNTGIQIQVLTEKEEAKVGFLGASSLAGRNDVLVWDVGGGSQQFSFQDGEELRSFSLELASVSFKRSIIERVKGLDPLKTSSPNPIGMAKLPSGEALARSFASLVPDEFKSKIIEQNHSIVGIGGVHAFSIRGQVNTESNRYSIEQVKEALDARIDLGDDEIAGSYADTEISNLILIYGFMKELGIHQVHAFDVNLTDGLFFFDFDKK